MDSKRKEVAKAATDLWTSLDLSSDEVTAERIAGALERIAEALEQLAMQPEIALESTGVTAARGELRELGVHLTETGRWPWEGNHTETLGGSIYADVVRTDYPVWSPPDPRPAVPEADQDRELGEQERRHMEMLEQIRLQNVERVARAAALTTRVTNRRP